MKKNFGSFWNHICKLLVVIMIFLFVTIYVYRQEKNVYQIPVNICYQRRKLVIGGNFSNYPEITK